MAGSDIQSVEEQVRRAFLLQEMKRREEKLERALREADAAIEAIKADHKTKRRSTVWGITKSVLGFANQGCKSFNAGLDDASQSIFNSLSKIS